MCGWRDARKPLCSVVFLLLRQRRKHLPAQFTVRTFRRFHLSPLMLMLMLLLLTLLRAAGRFPPMPFTFQMFLQLRLTGER